jgi:hypothetical protein
MPRQLCHRLVSVPLQVGKVSCANANETKTNPKLKQMTPNPELEKMNYLVEGVMGSIPG